MRDEFLGSGHTAHVRTPTLRRPPSRTTSTVMQRIALLGSDTAAAANLGEGPTIECALGSMRLGTMLTLRVDPPALLKYLPQIGGI